MTGLTYPPLPWKAFERDDGKWEIDHSANGSLTGTGFTKEEAEYIVRACNCYQDLIAACKSLIFECEDSPTAAGMRGLEPAWSMAMAAIKKATQE